MAERKFAVVVGVGPGLGVALTRKFSSEGLTVVAAARDGKRLAELLRRELLPGVDAITCDVGDEAQVKRLFAPLADKELEIVVHNAGGYARGQVVDLSAEEVERTWRVGGLGAFHVGQAAARAMLPKGRGSIIFTGATAALRGGAGFAAFAMSKFAARALAQSMARELGPKGIHVAHVNIDGGIGEDRGATKLKPEAIADIYWSLHVQDRSAWSQEIDLRPWAERF
jgi:NAD(P)-dependent dehydrogenase (short-subunit alcohol dehydrogenase family)